jgi:hypothetical protein
MVSTATGIWKILRHDFHGDEMSDVRVKVIARSGHAATHLPQPSHALELMSKACCHLCTKPLMRPESFRLLRSL